MILLVLLWGHMFAIGGYSCWLVGWWFLVIGYNRGRRGIACFGFRVLNVFMVSCILRI